VQPCRLQRDRLGIQQDLLQQAPHTRGFPGGQQGALGGCLRQIHLRQVLHGEADRGQRVAQFVHDARHELADRGEAGLFRQSQGATEAVGDQQREIRQQLQVILAVGAGKTGREYQHPGEGALCVQGQEDRVAALLLRQYPQEGEIGIAAGQFLDVGNVQQAAAVQALLQQGVAQREAGTAKIHRPAVAVDPFQLDPVLAGHKQHAHPIQRQQLRHVGVDKGKGLVEIASLLQCGGEPEQGVEPLGQQVEGLSQPADLIVCLHRHLVAEISVGDAPEAGDCGTQGPQHAQVEPDHDTGGQQHGGGETGPDQAVDPFAAAPGILFQRLDQLAAQSCQFRVHAEHVLRGRFQAGHLFRAEFLLQSSLISPPVPFQFLCGLLRLRAQARRHELVAEGEFRGEATAGECAAHLIEPLGTAAQVLIVEAQVALVAGLVLWRIVDVVHRPHGHALLRQPQFGSQAQQGALYSLLVEG